MISDAYKATLAATRELYPTWGGARRHAPLVLPWLERCGIVAGSVLDYGCGLGRFAEELERLAPGRYTVTGYDPGVPGREVLPAGPFDAVVATHVLEHVEPELLRATLLEIGERARRLIYVEVPHGPAGKLLTDGRDAHLIQWGPCAWFDELARAYPRANVTFYPVGPNTVFVVKL